VTGWLRQVTQTTSYCRAVSKNTGNCSLIRLPALQVIKFTVTRQLLNFYQICTATRKMPAEYFCQPASIKNWHSRHYCLLINTIRDKLLTFIKLVPRNTSWPFFYPDPGALQMEMDYCINKYISVICKAVLLLTPSSKL